MFFLFFMFENDRTHTLTHLNFGWQAPFQQDFPAFPFPTYYYSYSHQEGKKDWNCTATPFVFVLLCLMFVFLLRSAKGRFLTLGVGLVGRGFWIGFSFLIPSCTFFFYSPYLLYLSWCKHGLLSNSSACCGSVDGSKAYLSSIIFLLLLSLRCCTGLVNGLLIVYLFRWRRGSHWDGLV